MKRSLLLAISAVVVLTAWVLLFALGAGRSTIVTPPAAQEFGDPRRSAAVEAPTKTDGRGGMTAGGEKELEDRKEWVHEEEDFDEEDVEWVDPLPELAGTVTDAVNGKQVQEVTVRLDAMAAGGDKETETCEEGRYEIYTDLRGRYPLVVDHEEYEPQVKWVELDGREGHTCDFVLVPRVREETREAGEGKTAVVQGIVKDAWGAPVKGMEVRLDEAPLYKGSGGWSTAIGIVGPLDGKRKRPLLPEKREPMTDDEGRFEIGEVEPGRYTLRVLSDDHLFQESAPFVVQAGERVGFRLVLQDGASMAGMVTDTAGRPLKEARVHTDSEVSGSFIRTKYVLTDGEGRFTIRGLVPEVQYYVYASKEGYLPSKDDPCEPGAARHLTLNSECRIEGVVLDDVTGKPVPHAQVERTRPSDGMMWVPGLTTAEGRFTITRVRPGTYMLKAWTEGFSPSRVEVTVAPGQKIEGVTLRLERRE